MSCGLYGKLPVKRDFIAHNLPSGFLARWEPWLQGSLSAASLQVGPAWRQYFFSAPLWRFWLGKEIFGQSAIGVLMPSADGVGRQFPLCLIVSPAQGEEFSSLLHDTQIEWFGAVEEFLLLALEETRSFEQTLHALAEIPMLASTRPNATGAIETIGNCVFAKAENEASVTSPLSDLDAAQQQKSQQTQSIWWTIGGEGFPPSAMMSEGLPDQEAFLRLFLPIRPNTDAQR